MNEKRQQYIVKSAKLRVTYQTHKEHIAQVVNGWKTRYPKDYRRAQELLDRLHAAFTELDHLLSSDAHFDARNAAAALRSARRSYRNLYNVTKPLWRQWVEAIVVTFFGVLLLRNFVFGLYHVPTGSAEPTLLVGDRVWGNNMAYLLGGEPSYGDHVMFYDPEFHYKTNPLLRAWQRYVGFGVPLLGLPGGPANIVKRVIAKPGDTIEGRVENGKPVLYRNGQKLDEPYVNPYPLIGIQRSTGFIPLNMNLPWFLNWIRASSKPVFYTYDQRKPYSEQPFYHMSARDVYRPSDLYSGDLSKMFTYEELYRLRQNQSEYYLLQTLFSGTGVVVEDPESGGKRILKLSGSPEIDPRRGTIADVFGPVKLLKDQYWVMGDSRRNSYDSRFWGPLKRSDIYGRASFIIYSIDSEEPLWLFELLKHPIDFWTKSVRWSRILKGISNDNRA